MKVLVHDDAYFLKILEGIARIFWFDLIWREFVEKRSLLSPGRCGKIIFFKDLQNFEDFFRVSKFKIFMNSKGFFKIPASPSNLIKRIFEKGSILTQLETNAPSSKNIKLWDIRFWNPWSPEISTSRNPFKYFLLKLLCWIINKISQQIWRSWTRSIFLYFFPSSNFTHIRKHETSL